MINCMDVNQIFHTQSNLQLIHPHASFALIKILPLIATVRMGIADDRTDMAASARLPYRA